MSRQASGAAHLHAVDGRRNVPVTTGDAERNLIGAVIEAEDAAAKGEQRWDVVGIVGGDELAPHFSQLDLAAIWQVICARHRSGQANTLPELCEALLAAGIDNIGDTTQIVFSLTAMMTDAIEFTRSSIPALASAYARQIMGASTRRKAIANLRAALEQMETDPRQPHEFYEESIAPLVQLQMPPNAEPTFRESVMSTVERIEKLFGSNGETVTTGVPTGITEVNETLGGYQPGNLIVIGARPGMGKSSWALTAAAAAINAGIGTCFISAEMTREELITRLIARYAKLTGYRLFRGPMYASEHPALVRGAKNLSELPLQIVEKKFLWPEVLSAARRAVAGGARFVIMDYLGLFDLPGFDGPRAQELGVITKQAKQFALTCNVPVMLLAQLNRNVAENEEPFNHHLRDSGSIEQDANEILFLWRPSTMSKDETRVKISKQRNGPTGDIDVSWSGDHFCFRDRDDLYPRDSPLGGAAV